MSADREQLRQQIAEVLAEHRATWTWDQAANVMRATIASPEVVADALLPVVDAHTRAARADELEQAATDLDLHGRFDMPDTVLLRARARALRTHEGDVNA